jgi:hypothetical protein
MNEEQKDKEARQRAAGEELGRRFHAMVRQDIAELEAIQQMLRYLQPFTKRMLLCGRFGRLNSNAVKVSGEKDV